MIRAKVIVTSVDSTQVYEANIIVYQQGLEEFNGELKQVPAVILMTDDGEIFVQNMKMENKIVRVHKIESKTKPKRWFDKFNLSKLICKLGFHSYGAFESSKTELIKIAGTKCNETRKSRFCKFCGQNNTVVLWEPLR